MRTIDNTQDVMDSRDVIARRDELKEERDSLVETSQDESEPEAALDARAELVTWDIDNAEELAQLEAFIAEGFSSWEDGETLVRESYFETYAQELADSVVDNFRERSSQWPFSCIDWEHAARELQYDYTGADLDGITYYFRA